MIVRPIAEHLLFVTQPDHARLAAAIVEQWRGDGFPDRATRAVTLVAVAHHDDGWEEEDVAPSIDPDTGRPFDYLTLPAAGREAVWRRGVARAAARSAYAGALTAQHGATLARTAGRDAGWGSLAALLDDLRDRWYTAPAVDAADPPPGDRLFFLRDYALLAMGDLLSLMACGGRPVMADRDGYDVRLEGDHHVVVSPDPFGGRALRLEVPVRRLPASACASSEALREAWAGSAPAPLAVVVEGRAPVDAS